MQPTVDKFKAGTNQGAGKWNSASVGVSFTKVSSVSSADVVVQGYYSASGTDHCGSENIACVVYGSGHSYPHYTRQLKFYFVYGHPAPNAQGNPLTYEWSNNFREASGGFNILYMPIYVAHEFGHTAGLWHADSDTDAMSTPPNEMTNLATGDKKAMKAIYKNHTSH